MPYATQQDMVDQYGNDEVLVVADRDNDDTIDAPVVSRALDDATDEINVYIAKKYSLPLPSVPGVLKRLCTDIAFYRLSSNAASYTEEKRERYKDAIKTLEHIASGKASLGLPVQQTPASSAGNVEVIAPERQFSRSKMGRLT
jgi:phage gp36-like protein